MAIIWAHRAPSKNASKEGRKFTVSCFQNMGRFQRYTLTSLSEIQMYPVTKPCTLDDGYMSKNLRLLLQKTYFSLVSKIYVS